MFIQQTPALIGAVRIAHKVVSFVNEIKESVITTGNLTDRQSNQLDDYLHFVSKYHASVWTANKNIKNIILHKGDHASLDLVGFIKMVPVKVLDLDSANGAIVLSVISDSFWRFFDNLYQECTPFQFHCIKFCLVDLFSSLQHNYPPANKAKILSIDCRQELVRESLKELYALNLEELYRSTLKLI